MSRTKMLSAGAGVAMVVFFIASARAAPEFGASSLEPNRFMRIGDFPTAGPVSITQNVDPTIVEPSSIMCGSGGITTDNSALRLFDLDGDHGFTGPKCVSSLDYAEETVDVDQPLTVNVYCLDEGFPFLYQFMTLVDTSSFNQPAGSLIFGNAPFSGLGCCDAATQDLVLEIKSHDCLGTGECQQNFIGSNLQGQTAPSYIAADDCGIFDPVDMAAIGFPEVAWVMVVNFDACSGCSTDGSVPAAGATGIALMVVTILVTGAYFHRRRRATP